MRGNDDLSHFLPQRPDARRTGRVPIEETLHCSLGRIVDLSMGGARIESRRKVPGVAAVVRVWDHEGGLETEAAIAWQKKLGFFKYEIGIRFPPLDDGARAFLQRIASDHRYRQTINGINDTRDVA